MPTAFEKTKSVGRQFLPVSKLVANTSNPNEMTDEEFNLLASNIETTGMTDPILVRPIENDLYRVVGGHHRLDYAKLEGWEEVPVTIITDPDFDEDAERFQLVRMNTIRGHLSPEKFLKLYQSLSTKYADEVLQESFGFANEEDFKKLIKQVSASLPKEIKKDFDKAAAELKTIEGLSKLLNTLFTKHGETLKYSYMVFDYGGKESIWLRTSKETHKALLTIGGMCKNENRSMDAILGGLIRQVADGKHSETLLQLIAESEPINIPESFTGVPIEENLVGYEI